MTFIIGTGSYLPPHEIANESLQQFPATSLPLIAQKTGILARRHAESHVLTSDLGFEAATRCLERAAVEPSQVDVVILGTSTPDKPIPATATKVATRLGAVNALCYDLNSVCSSAVVALQQARSFIVSGYARNVLIITADCYSKILNPRDFSTYPYFGDGAGAVLLSGSIRSRLELLDGVFGSDGSGYETITVAKTASAAPPPDGGSVPPYYFQMNGRAVMEFVTSRVPGAITQLLVKHGVQADSVSALILHQANINIIREIGRQLNIPADRVFHNLERYGNTAAASVLIALDEYLRSSAPAPSSYIITCAFGGGLTWGSNLIKVE